MSKIWSGRVRPRVPTDSSQGTSDQHGCCVESRCLRNTQGCLPTAPSRRTSLGPQARQILGMHTPGGTSHEATSTMTNLGSPKDPAQWIQTQRKGPTMTKFCSVIFTDAATGNVTRGS
ncbi:uncharacterized protein LOC118541415 [Halichoerus grypus]